MEFWRFMETYVSKSAASDFEILKLLNLQCCLFLMVILIYIADNDQLGEMSLLSYNKTAFYKNSLIHSFFKSKNSKCLKIKGK